MKYVHRLPLLRIILGSFVVASIAVLAGCATTGTAGPGESTDGKHSDGSTYDNVDVLRVGDLVLVEFSGVGAPPPKHEEKIKLDGKLTLPDIGAIQAAGRTRGELQQAIHDAYVPNYFRQLTVIVRNEGRYFYVKGQVNNPNQFQYLKQITILQAIAAAGDFTDFAKKTKVQVTRANGRKLTVNCLKAVDDDKFDIPIYPDDTIEVPRRYF